MCGVDWSLNDRGCVYAVCVDGYANGLDEKIDDVFAKFYLEWLRRKRRKGGELREARHDRKDNWKETEREEIREKTRGEEKRNNTKVSI